MLDLHFNTFPTAFKGQLGKVECIPSPQTEGTNSTPKRERFYSSDLGSPVLRESERSASDAIGKTEILWACARETVESIDSQSNPFGCGRDWRQIIDGQTIEETLIALRWFSSETKLHKIEQIAPQRAGGPIREVEDSRTSQSAAIWTGYFTAPLGGFWAAAAF